MSWMALGISLPPILTFPLRKRKISDLPYDVRQVDSEDNMLKIVLK